MMHGALKHFHPGLMGSTQYFVADNFNHLLVMSAAFFTMLIDGALDCHREHVAECILREGNITEEECLGKVKEKLREVMAGLDHISQQIPKIDDILFDTTVSFFALRSLPSVYRIIGSTNTTNDGSDQKTRTNAELVDAIILRCLVQVVIHLLSCVGINPDLKKENFDEWSQFLLGFYNNVQLNQNEQPEWTKNNISTATALGKNLPRGLKEFVKHGVLSQKRRGLSVFSFMLIVLKNNLANWKAGNYTEKPFLGGSIWNSGAVDSTNILVGVGMKASRENV
eukprot:scaffold343827_cov162-Cyclotella_meneghiniana.AAC.1